ncbi:hypothetical protein [Nocardioides sp.]|uniref:hypothetical protein n=1 Tax=Nocardioides sp. TaxID=35761 RepID=UPI002635FF3D|nr:hypothetical protein [Nocardioides sp.]
MRLAHGDDPELRELLDSIGLHTPVAQPAPERDPAAIAMLATILATPRHDLAQRRRLPREPRAPRSAAVRWGTRVVAVAAVAVLVFALTQVLPQRGGGGPAVALTPPMLTLSGISEADAATAGSAADGVLTTLAEHASAAAAPADEPVQRLEIAGWWASTTPADGTAPVATVLLPTVSTVYVLPDGDRRAIERRGTPLDRYGRVAALPDGDSSAVSSDQTTPLDPSRGPDYPATLPTTVVGMREALAPAADCAGMVASCLLSSVQDLFENYVVPPAVTAVVWRTLATESGITSLGETKDRRGRTAQVLTAPSINPRQQILVLIDPDHGTYLGSENVLIKADENFGFDPPAVVSFTAVVSAQRVPVSAVPAVR